MEDVMTLQQQFEEKFGYKAQPVGAKYQTRFFRGEDTPNRVWHFITHEAREWYRKEAEKEGAWKFASYVALKGIESARMGNLYHEFIKDLDKYEEDK